MRRHLFGLTVALPLVLACAHAKQVAKEERPPAPAPAVAAAPAPAAPAAPAPQACSADDQCSASQLCVSDRCVAIGPGLAECTTAPAVHFDFDRAALRATDLPTLQRAARCLQALPPEKTLVDGNCDARGTVEYNLALGLRRAHAVTAYLESLGVPADRLAAVSYGKELPVCAEATEACWAENRRADVTRGAEAKDVASLVRRGEARERRAASAVAEQGKTPASARRAAAAHRAVAREQPAAVESPATPVR